MRLDFGASSHRNAENRNPRNSGSSRPGDSTASRCHVPRGLKEVRALRPSLKLGNANSENGKPGATKKGSNVNFQAGKNENETSVSGCLKTKLSFFTDRKVLKATCISVIKNGKKKEKDERRRSDETPKLPLGSLDHTDFVKRSCSAEVLRNKENVDKTPRKKVQGNVIKKCFGFNNENSPQKVELLLDV